jgi:UDP-galactopyranose mutase
MRTDSSFSDAPFRSFWSAGYEGADHINKYGQPVAMNEATQHMDRVAEDYAQLREFGIRTVRESVGWRLVEKDGYFDFSFLESRARAAQEMGLQIIWTLCHYGWPPEIGIYSPEFVERFSRFCRHVTEYLAPFSGEAPIYSPINEISFSSWALSENCFLDRDRLAHRQDGGWNAKRQMVRATIAGCNAIWEVNPAARIMHCDPIIHVIPPSGRPELAAAADAWRQSQFEAWDMLSGRLEPELGGDPRYLDIVGVNYYHSNQWESDSCSRLWWHLGDPRRVPLHSLLMEVQQRYQRPLLLAETSHVGSGRGAWIRDIAEQAALAIQHGVDLKGICIYPIIDRPDWDDPCHWHRSGLWEVNPAANADFQRVLSQPYAVALRQAQRLTKNLCSTYAPLRQQGGPMPSIIVFSHLRWDFVYQRPQQLLSRLAEHYRIVFIEEPVLQEGGDSFLKLSTPLPNVLVCQPHTPISMPGFHDDQLPLLRKLIRQLVVDYDDPIVWFYTPMAIPLLQELQPRLVVYDCMDELASFKNPPKQLLQREKALLKLADIVFAGGPSLYQAKCERHSNVHCFPSSVDVAHFEQALDRANSHPAHREIPGPRLGYYGVIDERFDAPLVAELADAHPQWQIVLVGPVLKIDPATLPQRPNIHYLGQQPYKALPHLLAGWDVCLLPFAINEATRFISPTKTLEYMAAELPIVSTPIADVASLYSDIVAVAADAPAFIAACEAALLATPEEKASMVAKMRQIVAATSWDETALQMHGLLQATPARQTSDVIATQDTSEPNPNVNPLRTPVSLHKAKCVIIGAGPTGLSAAYHLGQDSLLLDKNPEVGGWCRSIQDKGFTFDHAGHIMFSNDPYVLKLYHILLGSNMHWQDREAWVYSKGVHTRYPFQGALYGLPPAVIKECIVGAMEARFGDLHQTGAAASSNTGATAAAKVIEDCCADGSVDLACNDQNASSTSLRSEPRNFEEFIYKIWGAGIAKHFAIPYNKKLWTVPLTEMETSWLGGRVPLPDMEEIIEGALEPVAKPMGPNARFGYPLRGGFQALMSGFIPHLKGPLELNANVVQISPSQRIVALADGRRFSYEQLLSTMPLPELIKLIGEQAPEEVRQAARGLKHISVRCVNLGINRENITEKHWIYYPEDTIFHRIFVQGNASPGCNPPGGFGLTCEISYSPWKPLPVDGQALIDRCVADCIKVGMMKPEDSLITANLVDMPYAYVVYDHARARNVATVKDWLTAHDIVLAGRYSEWEYYNSDHAFIAGKKAAEAIAHEWSQQKKSALAD